MGKNKKPKVSTKPTDVITETSIENGQTQFVISYKYLCHNNSKYGMESIKDNKIKIQYYNDFIKKISDYSQLDNFKAHISSNTWYRNSNHIHPIDWNDTRIREKNFSCLPSKLMEQVKGDCYQLGINHVFRIHGFFIENIFYVVWLDPNHELYPRK